MFKKLTADLLKKSGENVCAASRISECDSVRASLKNRDPQKNISHQLQIGSDHQNIL